MASSQPMSFHSAVNFGINGTNMACYANSKNALSYRCLYAMCVCWLCVNVCVCMEGTEVCMWTLQNAPNHNFKYISNAKYMSLG